MDTNQHKMKVDSGKTMNSVPVEGLMYLKHLNLMLVKKGEKLFLISSIVFDYDRYIITDHAVKSFDNKILKLELLLKKDPRPDLTDLEILEPSHYVQEIEQHFGITAIGEHEKEIAGEIIVSVKKVNEKNNPFNIRPSKVKKISTGGESRPAKHRY